MLEITVISGKGGTGKTSLTGAFAHLAESHIICDLDVDAPDLHLILEPEHERVEMFHSGHIPIIDIERCTDCGECIDRCRYEAIVRTPEGPAVNTAACEGCKVCVHFCPAEAIDWVDRLCGEWYVSRTRFGPMVHAQLYPGQENSGRLVTLLRQEAREKADEMNRGLILSDGSPGIGCPVISSLAGTSLAVIVTEPTPSGRHDLERVSALCRHFRIPGAVIINKYNLNKDQSRAIADICLKNDLEIVGRLPYDSAFTEAMVRKKVITEYMNDGPAREIKAAWEKIVSLAQTRMAA